MVIHNEISFNLEPQYIKNTNLRFQGITLNEFQEFLLFLGKEHDDIKYLSEALKENDTNLSGEQILYLINKNKQILKNEDNIDKNVIFLHAPTGSGKTLGLLLPTISSYSSKFSGKIKTIITEPTNLIIDELYNDISDLSSKIKEEIRYTKMTGKNKDRNRLLDIPDKLVSNDIIITNIDIISLYISGFYLKNLHIKPEKAISWSCLFKLIKIFVIDEYHAYDEESMGKVISLILLNKLTGNDVKFIFTSGTPNRKFIDILKSFKINPIVKDIQSISGDGMETARQFRGNLKLIFTDKPLLEEDVNIVNNDRKVMYLFDHKIDAEQFIYKLKNSGIIPEEDTGFGNRSEKGNGDNVNHNIIVATNAVELGVNKNPDIAHIEPGKYAENFWQRLGRTGRGKNGIIYVHITTNQLEEVSKINYTEDYNVLINKIIDKISLNDRNFLAKRTKLNTSAFMYAVYRFSPHQCLKEQIKKVSNDLPDIKIYFKLEVLESKFYEKTLNKGADKLKDWINKFFKNFGYFRGITKNIKIKLPDQKITTDDYIYSKMHYEMEEDKNTNIFIVKSFLQKVNKINICYKGLYSRISLDGKDLYDSSRFSYEFSKDCDSFFDNYRDFSDLRDVIEKGLYDPYLISSSYFIPEEVVVENDDNIFL